MHPLTLTLLGLLLPFVSLSWAQTTSDSSLLSSSMPSSSSSMTSSNSSMSPSLTSSAQFPSLSGYSSCVTNCLAVGIARVNCSSITDVNCFCANTTFPAEVFSCIESTCPTDLMTEEKLAQQFCNLASSSISLTFPSAGPTTSSISSSSTSTPVSSSSHPSATAAASNGTTLTAATVLFTGFLAALFYTLFISVP